MQRGLHSVLKLEEKCYKSVAMIRLVKTENTSAYISVDSKVGRSELAM
jgi:hypothetical protein